VIPAVDAALAALRIESGELPSDEMDGYPFPGWRDGRCYCQVCQGRRAAIGFWHAS
jgi:hypothetical protein